MYAERRIERKERERETQASQTIAKENLITEVPWKRSKPSKLRSHLKRAAKNTKEENVALHHLVLIQRFCKPGKLSFSLFWHFNYIGVVASVREQLTHACSLDQPGH
jgi:hypothetical protein